MLATLLEILGFLLLMAAAYLVSLPLALFVAGAGLVIGAQTLSRPAQTSKRLKS